MQFPNEWTYSGPKKQLEMERDGGTNVHKFIISNLI